VRLRLRPEIHIVGADTDEARSRAIIKEIRGTKIEEEEEQ
jgi:hypothetical protein